MLLYFYAMSSVDPDLKYMNQVRTRNTALYRYFFFTCGTPITPFIPDWMPRIGSYCVSLQCFDFILGVSVLVHTKDVQMRIKAQ